MLGILDSLLQKIFLYLCLFFWLYIETNTVDIGDTGLHSQINQLPHYFQIFCFYK